MKRDFVTEMIIYVDVYILENLVINYFILLIAAYITRANVSSFRILFASILASLYSLFQFYPSVQFLYSLFGKIVISMLIVYLTFYPRNFFTFFRQLLSFYLVTIVFGGMVFFLYCITKDSLVVDVQVKLKNVLIALGCSLIVFKLSYELILKRMYKESLIRYIKFKINDTEYNCTAYIDTGNNLKEPFSGRPVVIVEKNLLKEKDSQVDISTQNLEELQRKFGNKIILIPYNSIGKQHGVLIGVIPDEFYVSENNTTWAKKDVAIALYDNKISSRYSALLGPDLI